MNSYNCCSANTRENQGIVTQVSLLKLIADESRLKLLCILSSGTHCVCELMEHVEMSQSLVSHHLADLKAAHIVQDKKVGRQVHYSLAKKGEEVIKLITSLSSEESV